MNRFVKTALALAAAGSVTQAGTGDNEWLELDSEINGLASSLQPPQEDGMGWTALIRGVYSHSSDDIATGGVGIDGPDLSGFNFNDVDIAFWGNQGPYMWRISTDIINNEAGQTGNVVDLEDAYIRFACGEYVHAWAGQFKPMPIRSSAVDPEKQLFIDRTALGSTFDFWDTGVGAQGTWEQISWWGAVFNGQNGHTRDHSYVVRLEWNVGTGAGSYEGAMGGSEELNATIGGAFVLDDTFDFTGIPGASGGDLDGDGDSDNIAYIFDVNGNVSNFGFGGEVAFFDNDFTATTDEDFSNLSGDSGVGGGGIVSDALVLADDSTPWNVTGSYLITPEWEVGVRYEDLDNGDFAGVSGSGPDNTLLSVVLNWYRSGKGAKWQAQWTDIDADSTFPDGSIFEIGFSVGATR